MSNTYKDYMVGIRCPACDHVCTRDNIEAEIQQDIEIEKRKRYRAFYYFCSSDRKMETIDEIPRTSRTREKSELQTDVTKKGYMSYTQIIFADNIEQAKEDCRDSKNYAEYRYYDR